MQHWHRCREPPLLVRQVENLPILLTIFVALSALSPVEMRVSCNHCISFASLMLEQLWLWLRSLGSICDRVLWPSFSSVTKISTQRFLKQNINVKLLLRTQSRLKDNDLQECFKIQFCQRFFPHPSTQTMRLKQILHRFDNWNIFCQKLAI